MILKVKCNLYCIYIVCLFPSKELHLLGFLFAVSRHFNLGGVWCSAKVSVGCGRKVNRVFQSESLDYGVWSQIKNLFGFPSAVFAFALP